MASQSTPVQKLFAVTELLECILLSLPSRDLLLSQRVNKTFRETIRHSQQLQKALFFHETPTHHHNPDLPPALNPLLTHYHDASPPFGKHVFSHGGSYFFVSPPRTGMATNPYPLIEQNDNGIWHLALDVEELIPKTLANFRSSSRSVALCFAQSADPSGWSSWEKMYLSSPPCDIRLRVGRNRAVHSEHHLLKHGGLWAKADSIDMPTAALGEILNQAKQPLVRLPRK